MNKNIKLSIATAAIVGSFSGCNVLFDDIGEQISSTVSTISGKIVDDYIKDANITIYNGTTPIGNAISDSTGSYTVDLQSADLISTYQTIQSSGGENTATGKKFVGVLKSEISKEEATSGIEVAVTPVTTFTSAIRSSMPTNATVAEVREKTANSLGIVQADINKDYSNFANNSDQLRKIQEKALTIQKLTELASQTVVSDSLDEDEVNTAYSTIMGNFAKTIFDKNISTGGTEVDLSSDINATALAGDEYKIQMVTKSVALTETMKSLAKVIDAMIDEDNSSGTTAGDKKAQERALEAIVSVTKDAISSGKPELAKNIAKGSVLTINAMIEDAGLEIVAGEAAVSVEDLIAIHGLDNEEAINDKADIMDVFATATIKDINRQLKAKVILTEIKAGGLDINTTTVSAKITKTDTAKQESEQKILIKAVENVAKKNKADSKSTAVTLAATLKIAKQIATNKSTDVTIAIKNAIKTTIAENNITNIIFSDIPTDIENEDGTSTDINIADIQELKKSTVEAVVETGTTTATLLSNADSTDTTLINTAETHANDLTEIKNAAVKNANTKKATYIAKIGADNYNSTLYSEIDSNVTATITAKIEDVNTSISPTEELNIRLGIMSAISDLLNQEDTDMLALRANLINKLEATATATAKSKVNNSYVVGIDDKDTFADTNITIGYTYTDSNSTLSGKNYEAYLSNDLNTTLTARAKTATKTYIDSLIVIFNDKVTEIANMLSDIADVNDINTTTIISSLSTIVSDANFTRAETAQKAYNDIMVSKNVKGILAENTAYVNAESNASAFYNSYEAYTPIDTTYLTTFKTALTTNITNLSISGITDSIKQSAISKYVNLKDDNVSAENTAFKTSVTNAINTLVLTIPATTDVNITMNESDYNLTTLATNGLSSFTGAQFSYAMSKATEEGSELRTKVTNLVTAITNYKTLVATTNTQAMDDEKAMDTFNIKDNTITLGDHNVTIEDNATFTTTHTVIAEANLSDYYDVSFEVVDVESNVSTEYNTSLTTSPVPWSNMENGDSKIIDFTFNIQGEDKELSVALKNVNITRGGETGYDGNYTISTQNAKMDASYVKDGVDYEMTSSNGYGDNIYVSNGNIFNYNIAGMIDKLKTKYPTEVADIEQQFTKDGSYTVTITIKGFDGMNNIEADDNSIIQITGTATLTLPHGN